MVDYVAESKPAIIDQDGRTAIRVAVVGVVLGVIAWGLTLFLERVVLGAVLCGDESSVQCANISAYAGNIAAVIVMIIGVVSLVKMSVYRPLLIALGTVVSLWGLAAWMKDLQYLESLAWTVLLYSVFYSLYAWIARIRHAVVVLVVFILVAAVTRLVPMLV